MLAHTVSTRIHTAIVMICYFLEGGPTAFVAEPEDLCVDPGITERQNASQI